jgi:hypothetical protein
MDQVGPCPCVLLAGFSPDDMHWAPRADVTCRGDELRCYMPGAALMDGGVFMLQMSWVGLSADTHAGRQGSHRQRNKTDEGRQIVPMAGGRHKHQQKTETCNLCS